MINLNILKPPLIQVVNDMSLEIHNECFSSLRGLFSAHVLRQRNRLSSIYKKYWLIWLH
jgi:hypothetical protein